MIVQPDVTFFDQQGNPILFIEIVATHKPDDEKLSKLKRLGINTVAITIPKKSAEAIERIFYHTDHTYWLYNHEEEAARYVSISRRDSEEVLPINQLQRRLLEESVNCRTTEIGNLIRAIERCLESEQYRAVEQNLRAELSRVTDNAARDQQRLLRLQASHKKRIEIPFRGRILQVAKTASVRKGQSTHLSYTDILKQNKLPELEVTKESKSGPEQEGFSSKSFCANFIEVQVHPVTGMVRVTRVVSAIDAGRIINHKTAHSQVLGLAIWGIGMGLMEDGIIDHRYGRYVNKDLAEYYVPVFAVTPEVDVIFIDKPDSFVGPIGSKSLGEINIVGFAAALANAVYHATGKRIRERPIS